MSPDELGQMRIDESGIESLELMELLMEVEDTYQIEISDSMISEDLTINGLCELAESLIRK